MSKPVQCKHLDFTEGKFTDCTIRTLAPHYPGVQYWERGPVWTEGGNPQNVQFCGQGRGRINGILQCYLPGEMPCYTPIQETPDPERAVTKAGHEADRLEDR